VTKVIEIREITENVQSFWAPYAGEEIQIEVQV